MTQGAQLLKDAQQVTLIEDLKSWTQEEQATFMRQIVELNKVTPTGLVKYCERGRKLLADSAANKNPYDKFRPEVPQGVYLQPGEASFDEFEEAGLDELAKTGFVLIAGGLGERLGFSSIKISLPVVTINEDYYSYLKYYADYA